MVKWTGDLAMLKVSSNRLERLGIEHMIPDLESEWLIYHIMVALQIVCLIIKERDLTFGYSA